MRHDVARQGSNFGRVVMRADDMQVVEMAHQGRSRGPPASAISAAVRRVKATSFSAAVCTIDTQAMLGTSGGG